MKNISYFTYAILMYISNTTESKTESKLEIR